MIWCVDDDVAIRDIEVYTLCSMGHQARGFADGKEMFEALETQLPELILLDIMLPGEDGVTILKKLRAHPRTAGVPVIMATAKGTEMDKIQGLNIGADDYLVKPFGMMEMVARINAVLRRSGAKQAADSLTIGPVSLHEREHLVTVNGNRVHLTLKEFALLRLFMQYPGVVFSREQLLSTVWGVEYLGESRTVDVHIKTLRQKMGTAGKMIETVIGVGYRLEEQP